MIDLTEEMSRGSPDADSDADAGANAGANARADAGADAGADASADTGADTRAQWELREGSPHGYTAAMFNNVAFAGKCYYPGLI